MDTLKIELSRIRSNKFIMKVVARTPIEEKTSLEDILVALIHLVENMDSNYLDLVEFTKLQKEE